MLAEEYVENMIKNIEVPKDFKDTLKLPFYMFSERDNMRWECIEIDGNIKHKFIFNNKLSSPYHEIKDYDEALNILYKLRSEGYEPILYPKFTFKYKKNIIK